MKIELTICLENKQNQRILRSYASVGRAFDAVQRALDLLDESKLDEAGKDTLSDAYEVVELLKAPLDELHQIIRPILAEQNVERLWPYSSVP